MQNLTPETQEIAIEGLQISKFSRGRMPPDPPRWSRAFGVRFAPPKNEGLATPLTTAPVRDIFK